MQMEDGENCLLCNDGSLNLPSRPGCFQATCHSWGAKPGSRNPQIIIIIIIIIIYPHGNPAGVAVASGGSHMSRTLVQRVRYGAKKFCSILNDFIQELGKPRAGFSGEGDVPWFQLSPGGRKLSLHILPGCKYSVHRTLGVLVPHPQYEHHPIRLWPFYHSLSG